MNSTDATLIEQLSDPKSSTRRSAAKKIRKARIHEAESALIAALVKELKDTRTWETQYQMIMALGACGHSGSLEFLEELSEKDFVGMIHVALGDAIFRLSSGSDGDLRKAIEFIDRDNPPLIHGAFQAMAMKRIVPDNEEQARRIIDYGCSIRLGDNDWAVVWLLRAMPGWPSEWIKPLLDYWSDVPFKEQQQIHGAVILASESKYQKWAPL